MRSCFTRIGVQYGFRRLGVPTQEVMQDERFSAQFRMYTSDTGCNLLHIRGIASRQMAASICCCEPCPHPAFKVNDLGAALAGHKVLLAPYERIEGFHVAIIEDGGMPIELIRTTLTDKQI